MFAKLYACLYRLQPDPDLPPGADRQWLFGCALCQNLFAWESHRVIQAYTPSNEVIYAAVCQECHHREIVGSIEQSEPSDQFLCYWCLRPTSYSLAFEMPVIVSPEGKGIVLSCKGCHRNWIMALDGALEPMKSDLCPLCGLIIGDESRVVVCHTVRGGEISINVCRECAREQVPSLQAAG